MPSGRSPALSRFSPMSGAIPIASPSPTTACCPWTDGKVTLPLEGLPGRQSAGRRMTLAAEEFIRRFLIHVLPDGFHRIRYFGFLSNCHRAQKLALCRELLGMATDRTGSRSARRLPRPVRGTDRAVIAGVPALPYRHHGGDRLHRAVQSLPAGSGHIMTRNRRSNCMNRNRRPDRDGVARPVTATRVPDHCQNSQTSSAMTARSPDCVGPSRQSADPRTLRWRIGKGSGAIQRP